MAHIQAPVLAIYGENDPSVPREQIEKLRELFQQAGKEYEVLTYPAVHAFVNPAHEMGDAEAAWERALAFLSTHLGTPPAAPSAP